MSSHSLILVVEDDPCDQELMLMALRRIGFTEQVHCVDSALAAIAYIQGDGSYADRARFPHPTLIITDLQMPGGDGYSLLRHLRNYPDKQRCPVAVFSSLDDDEHIDQARQLGAVAYIVKPMTFAEICSALQALLWSEDRYVGAVFLKGIASVRDRQCLRNSEAFGSAEAGKANLVRCQGGDDEMTAKTGRNPTPL